MKYPIGIQNFESLRKDNYTYVDKTALVYELATSGRYYFLSRPRRFGKSMLISTLEAYFTGKKELFKGLAIEHLETEWTLHPILHLDLNTERYDTPESLNRVLNDSLSAWESTYGTRESETSLALRFKGVVERAAQQTGQRVVILVDEYDKPMLQAIGNEALQDEFRATLKAFYSVLKTQDRYIKFALLTGVTKFGKVSVFSDLNNLDDISMDHRYVALCGVTEEELHTTFAPAVEQLAEACHLSIEDCYAELRRRFDGYHFEHDTQGIYNPFSLLNTFAKGVFRDYWFETGTPSFLVQLMQHANYDLRQIEEEELDGDVLNSIDSMSRNPIPIIYQSGYLTIKGYDERFQMYRLGFPNDEVRTGFTRFLLPFYTTIEENRSQFFVATFVKEVERGNVDAFMSRLQTFFDGGDNRIAGKAELYFQNAMYVVFQMMGFYTEVERSTSRGRIDVVIKTKDYIYVLELKLDGSADEALQQIRERGYTRPFAADGREVIAVGVNFDSQTRTIAEWKVESCSAAPATELS